VRKRAVIASVVASIGVLLVGWQLGSTAFDTATPTTSATAAGSGPATPSATQTPARTAPSDGTYAGSVADTPFGSVQVQVTISGGAITDVTALRLTNAGGRSVQISNRAAPLLRQEILASRSAHVGNISGATYTSRGYLSSLQSALDAAGF
jgi:uncharacterized protein with FMN-binding domain